MRKTDSAFLIAVLCAVWAEYAGSQHDSIFAIIAFILAAVWTIIAFNRIEDNGWK